MEASQTKELLLLGNARKSQVPHQEKDKASISFIQHGLMQQNLLASTKKSFILLLMSLQSKFTGIL